MEANNNSDHTEPQLEAAQRRGQRICLILLVVFFILALLSGDFFLVLISFVLLLNVSGAIQQQVRDEQEQLEAQRTAGLVRIVPADPRMADLTGPAAGTLQVNGQEYMVVQLSNGQTYHVPLAGAIGAGVATQAMPYAQAQAVEITDPQTGAILRTVATSAIPLLTSDTPTAHAASPQPSDPPINTATTWMEDCEAAKQREGAEDEAAALYGSGVAYERRPDSQDVPTGEVTCVEVHDSPVVDCLSSPYTLPGHVTQSSTREIAPDNGGREEKPDMGKKNDEDY